MEIDKSEITMKRVLGSGNFGEVWYGKLYRQSVINYVPMLVLNLPSCSQETFYFNSFFFFFLHILKDNFDFSLLR